MIRLYLVRHGETEWNALGKMQGHKDSPLTDLGKAQAIEAKQKLKKIHFDIAYSSPSGRAVKTTQIILGGKQTQIKVMDELKEINLGALEGRTKEDIQNKYPQEYENFWKFPDDYQSVQGETFVELQQRAVAAVLKIFKDNKDCNILLVSHCTFIKVTLAYFEGRPIEKIWKPPFVENGSHSIIEENTNREYKVVLYGGKTKWSCA